MFCGRTSIKVGMCSDSLLLKYFGKYLHVNSKVMEQEVDKYFQYLVPDV